MDRKIGVVAGEIGQCRCDPVPAKIGRGRNTQHAPCDRHSDPLGVGAIARKADDLAEGRLVECLAEVPWQEMTLYATFLPGNPLSPRVLLALDWLSEVICQTCTSANLW